MNREYAIAKNILKDLKYRYKFVLTEEEVMINHNCTREIAKKVLENVEKYLIKNFEIVKGSDFIAGKRKQWLK